MKVTDFTCPEAGSIVRSFAGYDTFVPAKLPPTIDYDQDLVLALSRADAALSELSGVGRHLPNPHLLISPYLRREAVLSSRIEGTRASLSDVLLDEIDAGEEPRPLESDILEVRNYVAAMEQSIEGLRERPVLGLNLVKDLHERLMHNIPGERGENASPGRFRTTQNWIGPKGSTPRTAVYVPPPPERLADCLDDWERFLNERETMPDLVQCAIMHEQFEAIHPFNDGNGRVGRLLITLFLIERGRLSQPLLNLSAYIEANRQDYYDLLQRVRTHGDWRSWIRFFAEGVAETARAAVEQTTELMDLREDFRARLLGKPRALALVDWLFVNPYVTARRVQRALDVSDPTARNAIAVLEAEGLLHEITGRSWRRVYVCGPILRAIEGERLPVTTPTKGSNPQ